MDTLQLAEVERALQRAGITGPALSGILAMARIVSGDAGPQAGRVCECGVPIPQFALEEMPRLSTIARRFHRDSLRRCEVVGTPIEDPSWNMMLAIYADAAEGGYTSTTSACFASGVPQTTALRHLERMRRDGLITKHEDPLDARRTLVKPTSSAMGKMESMIRAFCVPRQAAQIS